MKWYPKTEAGKALYEECGNTPEGAERFALELFNRNMIEEVVHLGKWSEYENVFEVCFIYEKFREIQRRERERREKADEINALLREARDVIAYEIAEQRKYKDEKGYEKYTDMLWNVDEALYDLINEIGRF